MRALLLSFLVLLGLTACVDKLEDTFRGKLTILVVDGTITNLAEPQIVTLNRSGSDPLTGLPSSLPITKASVEVVVDSGQVIPAHETVDGRYQLPSDFKGQIGHSYQLRFTLPDGTHYVSTQQVMPAVPPIASVRAQFNPTSLAAEPVRGITAAHDLFIDTQDPVNQTNYYRWDWKLWEKQDWCRTCVQGQYSINNVLVLTSPYGQEYFQTGDLLFEDCFFPPPPPNGGRYPYWVYDYPCRTQCWAIFYGYKLNIFSDIYANGGLILNRQVAQIPFYQHEPCLVEIRQASLTPSAYRFYTLLADQTQNNGGVADTPPTASVGNVQNAANRQERIMGVFTASAVSTNRYWLDRKDTQGSIPPGLFQALQGRDPVLEPIKPRGEPALDIINNTAQQPPYTAICTPTDGRTPFKPVGWRD